MIELHHIHKRFGKLEVLKGVSLGLKPATVTALIGPSGGGKSTLLRCANLLEVPQSGRLILGNLTMDFQEKPHQSQILQVRRRTGMIFQNFQLFPHLTAIQNVMEALVSVLKWEKPAAKERASTLLAKVGLSHKENSYPSTLSGGQQQRVAIARALAPSPEVLLCDEPTSALDPELAQEVVDVLKSLSQEGVTMLMATHDLRLAAGVAHHVAFLESGLIAEEGPPEELFTRPQKERTKAFIASLSESIAEGWTI